MNIIECENFCLDYLEGKFPRFVFGATDQGIYLARYFKVDAIIDDYVGVESIGNIKVIKLCNVPDNALVVSAVVFGKPLSVQKTLNAHGIRNLDFFMFMRLTKIEHPQFPFFFHSDFADEYMQNQTRYSAVRDLLADEHSINTFDALINFRLSSSLEYMNLFDFRPKQQYFDTFPGDDCPKKIFVDAGAFDGQTSASFAERNPDYESIYLFEPDLQCLEKTRATMASFRDARLYPYALSECNRILHLNSQGSFSEITDSGDIMITATSLDEILEVEPDFIKMDIEGHELQALEGARKIISRSTPKLAICAYHKIDDFWTIPELVFSMNSNYKLYMRHYTEGLLETVYYFIPAS